MKKIKIRLSFESGKKFYEPDYKNTYDCIQASKKDAVRKFRKKYPNAIIYDVFSFGDDDYIEGNISISTLVAGCFYLPSKANYRQIIKMGKIKLN